MANQYLLQPQYKNTRNFYGISLVVYIYWPYFFFIFFGKGKGGVVVKRLTANMEILDQRFDECRPEAEYSTFKEGSPDHIDIEIEQLPIQVGEELEFQLNRKTLANVKVERDKEAEFDQWSDELVIKYQGVDVLKGTFQ